ncbi:MAG: molybdopterin-dependent oxidoreductase [Pseudomonadota bacterium]
MRFLRHLILALALASPGAALAHEVSSPKGMVVLTVSGDVAHYNRGPALEDGRDFLSKFDITFDKAMEFDLAGLAALEQGEITRQIYPDVFEGTFTGPKLAAVLEAAGVSGSTVWAMALDGYSSEIPADNIVSQDPILATHLDGVPLGIGTFGPTTVVFPVSEDPEVNEVTKRMLPWATFYLEVE